MEALTPVRPALRSLHEHRLFSEQVSLIHASSRPIIPSPTTLGLPPSLSHPTPQRVGFLTRVSPGFASHSQARQLSGRIAFVILRTDRSPPAAPHPASRRRSCNRLQAGEGVPEEDFHLSDQMRFQAHECASLLALWFGAACCSEGCERNKRCAMKAGASCTPNGLDVRLAYL
jgi:hypothetical protein